MNFLFLFILPPTIVLGLHGPQITIGNKYEQNINFKRKVKAVHRIVKILW